MVWAFVGIIRSVIRLYRWDYLILGGRFNFRGGGIAGYMRATGVRSHTRSPWF